MKATTHIKNLIQETRDNLSIALKKEYDRSTPQLNIPYINWLEGSATAYDYCIALLEELEK